VGHHICRTKPDQRDAYLTSLKENTAPILEEEKKEGLVLDCKILNNLTQKDPHDWDLAIAVQYKNFAALDGVEIKELEIRNKMLGSKKAAEETMVQKRVENAGSGEHRAVSGVKDEVSVEKTARDSVVKRLAPGEIRTTPNLLNNLAPSAAVFRRLTPFFTLLLGKPCLSSGRSIG
jgi:hypothetical protein